jgi:hypothetical protein
VTVDVKVECFASGEGRMWRCGGVARSRRRCTRAMVPRPTRLSTAKHLERWILHKPCTALRRDTCEGKLYQGEKFP